MGRALSVFAVMVMMIAGLAGQLCHRDTEQWFFFAPRQEREARGGRPNRTTASGYWKATGSPGYVYSSDNKVIGVKKTMVFYRGKAPTGRKTKWKMNEYRAIQEEANTSNIAIPKVCGLFVLCSLEDARATVFLNYFSLKKTERESNSQIYFLKAKCFWSCIAFLE